MNSFPSAIVEGDAVDEEALLLLLIVGPLLLSLLRSQERERLKSNDDLLSVKKSADLVRY